MAKFTPGAIISEIRNKIAATVYSKNAAGAVIRNRVTPINPRTSKQTQRRQVLAALAASWRGITQAQRDGWNAVSSSFPQTDTLGQAVLLTGAQLYVRSNANLVLLGLAQITAAPVPAAFAVITFGATTMAAGVLTVAFLPTPVPAGFHLALYATAAGSAGRQFFPTSSFRFIQAAAPAAASPIIGTAAYAAQFGSAPPAGTKLAVQLHLIQATSGLAGQFIRLNIIAT